MFQKVTGIMMTIRGDIMHAWMIFVRQLPFDFYLPKYLVGAFLGALIISLFIFSFVKIKAIKSHKAQ